MAIRITQPLMYNSMVGNMQTGLSNYMQSVEQSATQKRINRPSDDPAGTYRVLMTRDDIDTTQQLMTNIKTARGWLQLEDSVLSNEVSTVLTQLKELAEQASTGTYTAENREQMAFEARELFGSLLNLANTRYEGKSVFAGHKYDESAFDMALGLTSWDDTWNEAIQEGSYSVMGDTSTSVLVQFTEDSKLSAEPAFQYTKDGGKTWETGAVEAKQETLPDGSTLDYYELDLKGTVIRVDKDLDVKVEEADPDAIRFGAADNGTVLYVRPTAVYNGDDNDPPVQMTVMGTPADDLETSVDGEFKTNVLVRVEDEVDLTMAGNEFVWSYSLDGGENWVTARGTTPGDEKMRLPVPGGFMDIKGQTINKGTQILAKPDRADLGYEIYDGTYLAVNGVGKDIFGGYYEGKPAIEGRENLFEVVGAFIGYLENNNQDGCQKTLAQLKDVQEHILTEATRIGGKENRCEVALNVMTYRLSDQKEQLSNVEDIDLTDLMTKLAQQQMTYQAVLQASSNIMNLSLANYV